MELMCEDMAEIGMTPASRSSVTINGRAHWELPFADSESEFFN